MADFYVRSTDGNNADDGSTWALAKADIHTTAWAAGSRVFVSDAHAPSALAGAMTIATGGTLASPTLILCGDDAAEPPTAVATTATATTSGANGITFTGACYVYGITFNCGTGGSAASISQSGDGILQSFDSCVFRLGTSSGGASIALGSGSTAIETRSDWKNCTVRFGAAGQKISVSQARFRWNGGGLESGGTSPTALVAPGIDGFDVVLSGLDLSAASAGINIFASSTVPGLGRIRNSTLPASWSGSLGTPTGPACRYEMHNCDESGADTNYRLWVEDYAGSIKSETTIVRTGGASDGTTALSWKMASSANAEYPVIVLESPEIAQWNDTTGSSITATVEIVTDNVTLNDDECWLEVQYLGTASNSNSSFISDCKADVLASAAAQTSSSETWTTTGLGTPVKQKLSVSFTPQEKGYIHAVVHLAKASTTVYVDPKITVT